MKNILKYTKTFILSSAILLSSCQESQDVEGVISTDDYPVLSYEVLDATTVNEGGNPQIRVKVSLDKPIRESIVISAKQIGGNAVLHDDYDIVNATIAPYTKEATLVVDIHEDEAIESKETLKLELYAPSLANTYLVHPTKSTYGPFSIEINNFEGDDLVVRMFWKTTDEATYHADSQDLDFAIEDAAGNEILGAYTGGFPEELTLLGTAPDGEYYINVDYWVQEDFTFPGDASLFDTAYYFQITKAGVFSETSGDSDWVGTSYLNWSAYGAFGGNGWKPRVAQITKAGTTYTFKDMSGNVIASGKFSRKESPRLKTEGIKSL